MEQKLQLCVFIILIGASLAKWQHMTVLKGQTVDLSCPVTNHHQNHMDWKNPQGYILFFKRSNGEVHKGLKSKRYSINKLSESEFTVSIANVTFKDGGIYTCAQYGGHPTETKVELTVLGHPRIQTTNHGGKFDIKCTSEGSLYPPQIFWKLDNGPKILAHSQVLHQDEKYVSRAMLSIQSVENGVTVKCLVHHPTLHLQPLMDFIQIQQSSKKPCHATRSPTARPQGSSEVAGTTTDVLRNRKTTVYLTDKRVNGTSANFSTTASSEPKVETASSGFSQNFSTNGWTSVSDTTVEITSFNRTENNRTGEFDDMTMQRNSETKSSLLVFLVTCLILGLLVVVIFFGIKLRRAHIAWKRENEDSDPSEESSKSKSSQEEKNSQGQRQRGNFNTGVTQYVVNEPSAITSVINTAAMATSDSIHKDVTSQPQTLGPCLAKCHIKETEL